MGFAGKGEARIRLNPAICQSFPMDKALCGSASAFAAAKWERSQEGDVRSNQEPPNALSLIQQSKSQRPNLKELHFKISRTEANGRSIISGFQKCLSSHLWACPSAAYCKSRLTRASRVVFHLRKTVSPQFQQMALTLLSTTATFQWISASVSR